MFGIAWLTPVVFSAICVGLSMLIQAVLRAYPTDAKLDPVLTWIENFLGSINPGIISKVIPNTAIKVTPVSAAADNIAGTLKSIEDFLNAHDSNIPKPTAPAAADQPKTQ